MRSVAWKYQIKTELYQISYLIKYSQLLQLKCKLSLVVKDILPKSNVCIITKLLLSQVAQTKSKLHNEFGSFRIMTIIHRICSWSYELKNVFRKRRETIRIAKTMIQFIPFRDSDGKKEILRKLCFAQRIVFLYTRCSIWCLPYRN